MKINCFILFPDINETGKTITTLKNSPLIDKIYLLHKNNPEIDEAGYEYIQTDLPTSSSTLRKIASYADSAYTMIYTDSSGFSPGLFAIERIIQVAQDTNAGLIYSDYYTEINNEKRINPVITYQRGSIRDDFNFGPMLTFNTAILKEAVKKMNMDYIYAGLYDLRLKVSEISNLIHINEYLYTEIKNDNSGKHIKQFDYVDPKNREVQLEMEKACCEHLRNIGAYLYPKFKKVDLNQVLFEYEASVIIPVKNRIRTIRDAIKSVLQQKTNFSFNIIVIDNYSTDGTSEAIAEFSDNKNLIHIIPPHKDLGIGGCWNLGIHHQKCGKFAVQLDSDDIYSDENTLQKIINAFYEQNCPMIVGTYKLTDFDLNTIPPGIIDHKEWTWDNGRNNALRINGLGAPRAFYTPLLRQFNLPNTSYGEDYALGLRFSREYQIGRIYDVLYLCRRWEDNSDASPDILKMNSHNYYKDRLRTWEIEARISLNKS